MTPMPDSEKPREVVIDGVIYAPLGATWTSEQERRAARAIFEVTAGGVPFGPRKRRNGKPASGAYVDCGLLASVALNAALKGDN